MGESAEKVYLFEKMPIARAFFKLVVPTMRGMLVTVIYNLTDTFFVGMLNEPVQNAAIALSTPVTLSFNAVNNLFGIGSSSMMSRALGRRDYETVKRSSAFGFYCAIFCGLLISLVCTVFRPSLLRLLGADAVTQAATGGYLKWVACFGAAPAILNVVMAYMVRSEGLALHASVGTMSGCALNILLDPFFILPQWGGMGAAGAGLATFIANCGACLYFLILLFIKRGRTYVCIRPSMFGFRREVTRGIFGVGVPACVQNLLNVTGMMVLNNFAAPFGPNAVAAIGVAQKVNMVPVHMTFGLTQGIMPIISYNYAARNEARMRQTLLFAMKISVSVITALAICYFIFSESLIRFFIVDELVVAYGGRYLRGLCLSLPFVCIDFIGVAVYQACGMGKTALIFAVFRKIVLEIPAICLLNYLFPLYGLSYAQFSAEIILAAAACVVLTRLFRRFKTEFAAAPPDSLKD